MRKNTNNQQKISNIWIYYFTILSVWFNLMNFSPLNLKKILNHSRIMFIHKKNLLLCKTNNKTVSNSSCWQLNIIINSFAVFIFVFKYLYLLEVYLYTLKIHLISICLCTLMQLPVFFSKNVVSYTHHIT